MTIELGAAYISILPSTAKLAPGIKGELSKVERDAKASGDRSGAGFAAGFGAKFKSFAKDGLFAGLGGVSLLGGLGIKTAADMEQAEVAFTTMLGSGKKAKAFIADLSKFASHTPFDFPSLQTAASSLISAGINAEDVIPIMTSKAVKPLIPLIKSILAGTSKAVGPALMIVSKGLVAVLKAGVEWGQKHKTTMTVLATAVGAVASALAAYKVVQVATIALGRASYLWQSKDVIIGASRIAITNAMAVAQGKLNLAMTANPIGLVVAALAALAVGLFVAYKKSETFRNIVNGAFSAVKNIAVGVLS